jgi:hypothetical protein
MKITLYVANRRKNKLMAAFDLCPPYKVFAEPMDHDFERVGTDTDAFACRLIRGSQLDESSEFWIPAVVLNGKIYSSPEIKVISDGKREMFL